VTQMTPIPATVLNVDKQGGEYLITVQVESGACPGAFDQLGFEIKPDLGWYHYDWLDLIYHRNPGLKAGQALAQATIEGFKNPIHKLEADILLRFHDFVPRQGLHRPLPDCCLLPSKISPSMVRSILRYGRPSRAVLDMRTRSHARL
jgi:hypothetical protein